MSVQLVGVGKHYGAHTVLDQVHLTLSSRSRVGVVGPNGAGKSTLLKVLAGIEDPDEGAVVRAPVSLTAGYLAQDRLDIRSGTLLDALAQRAGVAEAEAELHAAAGELAVAGSPGAPRADERYSAALERFVSLGGGDFEARARAICADLGLDVDLRRPAAALSGGETARAALAAILLSRFDVLLLDEPTNDLDLDGLQRLEGFLDAYPGSLALVSHDRALLDRTVERIVAIEPSSGHVTEWAGAWSDYAAARAAERRAAYARYEQAVARRKELTALLSKRRTEARATGDSLGKATGGADRRATQALRTKVRQAERLLERSELTEKPFEPWELRLTLDAGERPGDLVVALERAVAEHGAFRLGPVSLDLVPGERLVVTGQNGTGKSTLLDMLLGELPLLEGRRVVGRRTSIGALAQQRSAYAGDESLIRVFTARSGLREAPARTLLAKFGLGADHIGRPCSSLSPGEQTRAHLAELQSRRVNVLVLDEPTNHLDIEAIEQLEAALESYDGTVVVVSHDRRFLEHIAPTRELALGPDAGERPAASGP